MDPKSADKLIRYPAVPNFVIVNAIWLAFALIAFICRHQGLSFFDANEFATHVRGSGIPHAPGYPLYIMLSKIFLGMTGNPFDAQFCVSLLSNLICTNLLYAALVHKEEPESTSNRNSISAIITVMFFLCGPITQLYLRIPDVFQLALLLLAVAISAERPHNARIFLIQEQLRSTMVALAQTADNCS